VAPVSDSVIARVEVGIPPYTSVSAKSTSQGAGFRTSPRKGFEYIPDSPDCLGQRCFRTQTLRECTHAVVPVLLLAYKHFDTNLVGDRRRAG